MILPARSPALRGEGRGEGWGEGGDINLLPLPSIPPAKGGENFWKSEVQLDWPNERIQQIKKKRPGYGKILDFYQSVKEAQEKAKASLKIASIQLKKEWKKLLSQEGFSLIQKEDFPLDIESSVRLFETLCQVGRDANPHMADQMKKIKEAIDDKRIDLKKLLSGRIKGATDRGDCRRTCTGQKCVFVLNSEQHQTFN